MEFSGINYIAILVAAIGAFIAGSIYYGALAKKWLKAVGMKQEDAKMSPLLFAGTFVCELVLGFTLAGLIGHLGPEQATISNGIISAFFVWLGFIMMPMIVNHRYGDKGWDLTAIDGGHWLIVVVIMGAIIGYMGV